MSLKTSYLIAGPNGAGNRALEHDLNLKDMSLKTLYLIAGPNGAGKSTLVRDLGIEQQMEFLNADNIAAQIGDPDCVRAGVIMVQRIHQNLDEGKPFAFESTIAGRSHVSTLRIAKLKGYEIVMLYIFNENVALNLARVKQRKAKGEHGVPEDVVMRRFERSFENFNMTAELADEWHVYYTGASQYEPVVRSIDGEVLIQDQHKYNMFKQKTR